MWKGKALLIPSLILLTLVISGCTNLDNLNPFTTNIVDLAQNSENYLGKEITITSFIMNYGISQPLQWLEYYAWEENEEGKTIKFPLQYEKFYCVKCQVTGTVERIEVCTCQRQDCYEGRPCEDWYESPIRGTSEKEVDNCKGSKTADSIFGKITYNYRCKSDSTRYLYYLNVTKVRSLDSRRGI